jgi:thiamine kinase-like enzyme
MRCNTQFNPQTKRCVLKKGGVGQHILGRPKKCNTRYNPQTKRCILSSKTIKKKSTKKKSAKKKSAKKRTKVNKKDKIDAICLPKKFEDLAKQCACNSQWKRKEKVGSGAFGKAYRVCAVDGFDGRCEYVMKVQKYDRFAKAELQAYLGLKELRVTPKFYAAWRCRDMLYIVMERLFECTRPAAQIKHRVRQIAEKMEENGWLHGDFHEGNVMCTEKNRLVFIDFGYTVQRGKGPFPNNPGQSYTEIKKEQRQMLHEFGEDTSSSSS